MVRLPGNSYVETKRYLDVGAMGVIAPLVNSADDARELVRSVKYPPLGERSVGYGRAHGYGFSFDEYMKDANLNTFVCVQIEHANALKNLDEILLVKGVDAAFIGPYDLTASMGITAQFDHPDYQAALKRIVNRCKAHRVLPGIHVVQPKPMEVVERSNEGFRMIAYSLDITMVGSCCRNGLEIIRKRLNNDT